MPRRLNECALLLVVSVCACDRPLFHQLPETQPVPSTAGEDVTPPVVSFVTPLEGDRVTGTIEVTVDVSDDVGIVSVLFLEDGAQFDVLFREPYVANLEVGGSSDREAVLSVIAKDTSGNETEVAITVTVDNTPPTFDSTEVSPDPAGPGAILDIAFTASEELIADPTVTVADADASMVTGVSRDYHFGYAVTGAEDQGIATVRIAGTDLIGHEGAVIATVFLDFTPPGYGIVTPANQDTGEYVDASFDLSATFSDDGCGVESCELCRTTDGECDTEWQSASLAAGTCTGESLLCNDGESLLLNMRATDAAGNQAVADPVVRTCDASPPVAGALVLGSGSSASHVAGSGFDVSATFDDALSGVSGCEACQATDGTCDDEWSTTNFAAGTCAASLVCTGGDSVLLAMRATDGVGNVAEAVTTSRACDTTAPMVAPLTAANAANATHVSGTFDLSADASDSESGVVECEVCVSTDGVCDHEWSAAVFDAGTCSALGVTCGDGDGLLLNLRAIDAVGNIGVGTPLSRTCDDAAPTATAVTPGNQATVSHVSGTFDLLTDFDDTTSAVTGCEVCLATDGGCDDEWAQATFVAGTCSAVGLTCTDGDLLLLNMRAADIFGHVGTGVAVTRTCDDGAPIPSVQLGSGSDSSYVSGSGFDISADLDDPGSGFVACEVCSTIDGVCNDEWAPATLAAGVCTAASSCVAGDTVTLSVRATDAVGNTAESSPVSRACDADPPLVTGLTPANQATASHVSGSFDLFADASDLGAGVVDCEVCISADGVCDDEWTAASLAAGTCSAVGLGCSDGADLLLNMRATDAVGNVGAGLAATRTCDATGPAAAVVTPLNRATATHVGGSFDLTTDFVEGVGVVSCEVCLATDGACDTEWAPATPVGNTCSASGLGCIDGESLVLNMRATDLFSNTGAGTEVMRTCDTTGPGAGAVTPTAPATATHVGTQYGIATDFTDASGVSACEICVSTDGTCDTEWVAATFGAGICSLTDIACNNDDLLTLNMRATDALGNAGVGAAVTRTCDTVGPDIPVLSLDRSVRYQIVAAWTNVTDSGSGLPATAFTLEYDDDGSGEPYDGDIANEGPSPIGNLSGLSESLTGLPGCARHWMRLSVRDNLGNQSTSNEESARTVCGGDGTFANQGDFTAGNAPSSVAIGDFDGDAILDIAVANSISGGIDILIGDGTSGRGDGTFSLGSGPSGVGQPHFVMTDDFNRDGNLDLVTLDQLSNTVVVLPGDGSGNFGAADTTGVGVSPEAVIPGDFDADAILDLAVANGGSDTVSILIGGGSGGQGDGTFSSGTSPSVGTTPSAIVAGDFNSDAILDLAVGNRDSNDVSILIGDGSGGRGSGTFSPGASPSVGTAPAALIADDFNDDGIVDLAVVNDGSTNVGLLIGQGTNGRGDGTFAVAVSYAVGTNPSSVTAGDLDADHVVDLAVANSFDNSVSILLGDGSGGRGDGTFSAGPDPTAVLTTPRAVRAEDFDADNILDLAVAGHGGTVSILTGEGGSGRGNGIFTVVSSYDLVSDLVSIVARDFNHDGIVDLAALSQIENTLNIWLGNGADGRGDGSFAGHVVYPGCFSPYSIIAGDFDADNILDLAVGCIEGGGDGEGEMKILIGGGNSGRGDGTFTPGSTLAVKRPFSLTTGDFNSDGILDLALVSDHFDDVRIMIGGGTDGRGDGAFAAPVDYLDVGKLVVLTAGDFNADGILDLAVTHDSNQEMWILKGVGTNGRGDGSFLETGPYGTVDMPNAITTGDFNADAIVDLAVSSYSGELGILIGGGSGGRGDGTFSGSVIDTMGTAPCDSSMRSIATGDFNVDGILDLAVGTEDGYVCILTGGGNDGRGDGTFAMASNLIIGGGNSANDLAVADFDHDGILDLAVGSANGVYVLLGEGSYD